MSKHKKRKHKRVADPYDDYRELPVLVCARQFIIPSPFLLRSILFPYWGDIIFLSDKQLANQV